MTLKLVVGPPNSGRAGVVLKEFLQNLARRPLLVVPTADHTGRFERELIDREGALLGGSVVTFRRLFGEAAAASGVAAPPELSDGQRRRVVRDAVTQTGPRILAASAARPGFAAALDALISELQAGCLDPDSVAAAAGDLEDGAYLAELAELFAAYVARRDGLGRGDRHLTAALATSALREDPSLWPDRPVFLYGFDDLTREQLVLVQTLADAGEVTVAVTYEDRAALTERARLLEDLKDLTAAEVDELPPSGGHEAGELLRHIERHLFEPGERPRQPYDDGLVLLEAAGERAEAEQIGGEVARLLAEKTDPDSIAVVLRDPQANGALYESVFEAYEIPVAIDGRLSFADTVTGRGLLGLLRAALRDGSAADFLAFMRAPGRTSRANADWLELEIARNRLRTAGQAMETLDKPRWEVEKLQAAKSGPALLAACGEILASMSEFAWERQAKVHERHERLEIRAAAAARALLAELAELDGLEHSADEVVAALEEQRVWLDESDAQGRVRVLGPERVRANFFTDVFVGSLQLGEFPRSHSSDPFLSDEQRGALRLPPRATPEDQERHLFHSCVSRPSRRLYLSFRTLDADGGPSERSPFVDEVLSLIESPEEVPVRTRGLDDVVFAAGTAPSKRELDRTLAATGPRVQPELPGPLRLDPVLAELGNRDLFGASTLEGYWECSYRWFVNHELNPQTLEPRPDPMVQGSVVHAVLERLYRDPPGGDRLPTLATLETWREAARVLLAEEAEDRGLSPRDAATRAGYERMRGLIDAFLGREAESAPRLQPDPALLEAAFGDDPEDARGPMELEGSGGSLHGKIDRIDVAEENGRRFGLVRDYKLSTKATPYAKFGEDGKLQLLLYAIAAERLFGVAPLGGLYMPLAATKDARGRGVLDKGREELLDGLQYVGTDRLDGPVFAAALAEAEEKAKEIVKAIRQGEITRNPLGGECPRYCTFQSICRRERALPDPDETEEEEEAA